METNFFFLVSKKSFIDDCVSLMIALTRFRCNFLFYRTIFFLSIIITIAVLVAQSASFKCTTCIYSNTNQCLTEKNQYTRSFDSFSAECVSNYRNSLLNLIPHDPIHIYDNYDFITYGFPGNGTPESPYIIENLEITIDIQAEDGISIDGVSRSFIIQNCVIDATREDISISFIDSPHVIIRNNICKDSFYGIYLNSVENYQIENNTCSQNSINGIYLQSCSNISIYNNTIFDSDIGLEIQSSDNCVITDSLFFNNRIGFYFDLSQNFTITNNRFYNDGIEFTTYSIFDEYDLKYHTIENNFVNDLPLGYFHDLSNQTFSQDFGQLLLLRCNSSVINSVSISNTFAGVSLISCRNIEVKETTISYNYHGLRLDDSENCLIHDCSFQNNMFYGVDLSYDSVSNNIFLNEFVDNGILLNQEQAIDEGEGNKWYDRETKSGNYWSGSSDCYYSITGRAKSIDYYPLNRADTCPDFFLQRRLKIILPTVIIPVIIISLVRFAYLPLRRKKLDKLSEIDSTFLCPECSKKLYYNDKSCSYCGKLITREYLEKGILLPNYLDYDSICKIEQKKFITRIFSLIITSAVFGPLSFFICPIIFGPIWILSSGISLILALISSIKWITAIDDRNRALNHTNSEKLKK